MNDFQNNYLSEAVRHKVKLFTKAQYFKCFNYILSEKAKTMPAFKKISAIPFSTEILLKEKEKIRNKLKLIKLEKEKSKSLWNTIMLLICNVPNKKKLEYKKNEFNLNPICYSYITHLCKNKLKLLSSFSYTHKFPLDIIVKYYLDLCINQINDINNKFGKSIKLIDYKKLAKKSSTQILLKRQTASKNINNKSGEKKKSILGPPPIKYSNSFTRLFIGETDPKSVRERYFSNIVVKKLKQLHLYNSYQDLSNMYLKRLYNKLFKKDQKGIIDNDMAEILDKFKYDTKKVENFQRNALSFEKKNIRDNYVDEEKQNLVNQLERQKSLYMEFKNEKINKNKRKKNFKLSPILIRNDNKNKIRLRKNNSKIGGYSSIIFSSSNNNNKSQYLSFNQSSKRLRCSSANHSRNYLKNKLENKIGLSDSCINIYNKSKNDKKYKSIINNDLKIKKEVIRKSNNILKRMNKRMSDSKYNFQKNKKIKFKNYLKNEDFFFSNMN